MARRLLGPHDTLPCVLIGAEKKKMLSLSVEGIRSAVENWSDEPSKSLGPVTSCLLLQWEKTFCLRGGKRQKALKFSQLKKEHKNVDGMEQIWYVYSECGSKNFQGGFNSLNLDNKVVCQYESTPENDR